MPLHYGKKRAYPPQQIPKPAPAAPAQDLGITLAEGGWVGVEDLLAGCARRGVPITPAQLQEVVTGNDKQRFAFDESGTRIRAQQGHSVPVDLQLPPATPPAVLFHGTVAAALPAIYREGLQKLKRHHVHLSPTRSRPAGWGSAGASP
ncbi:RNA 2'-phosphotransferase [Hymenobacter cellulosilyticus]|uniref:RNA 2'-phosphotransferase n=1 Tax=Hymenobacter cellulosilyticus TaxID=2932248 RepID=A0A8T9Q613_9BACT|nr:RNA 2'-phosphotransferase [Hymenobacter cellulosilyticus]UOQ70889.1 RNA 2'-phosphotransferase [Hymenobacter cellulosilyticus]